MNETCANWLWGLVVLYVFSWIVARCARNRGSGVVSKDVDVEAAVDTLVGIGFAAWDAQERVETARRQHPRCTFNELVNHALRGHESNDF